MLSWKGYNPRSWIFCNSQDGGVPLVFDAFLPLESSEVPLIYHRNTAIILLPTCRVQALHVNPCGHN